MSEMIAAQTNGNGERAQVLADQLAPLLKLVGVKVTSLRRLPNGQQVEVVDKYRNPLPVKTVMAGLGMIEGLCRPPLGRMNAAGVATCRAAVRKVWETAPDVLRPIEAAFEVKIADRLEDDAVWSALATA
jgi:dihydrodipicolinate synthase/N-acetylneuraminate lyase